MKTMMLAAALLLAQIADPTVSVAQTVAVENAMGQRGFGFMLRHRSLCYVVLPEHVAGTRPEPGQFMLPQKVTVLTAAPVANGSSLVAMPFWEGMDLAIGVVRGGAEARCTADLSALEPSTRARTTRSALLLRLNARGEEDRTPLTIEDRAYYHVFARVDEAGARIGQGTSGAMAFTGDRIVGMAVTSSDTDRARFLRVEEIYPAVARYLEEQGVAFETAEAKGRDVAVDSAATGIPLELVSSSVPPVSPAYPPEATVGEGVFVFTPARNTVLTYRFADGGTHPVARLRMIAPPDAGHVLPRRVLIRLSATGPEGRYRVWERAEMGPDGLLDTGLRAYRNADHIQVMVLSTWGAGDVVIDTVTVE